MTRQPLGIHGETHRPPGTLGPDDLGGQDPIPGIPAQRISWGSMYGDGVAFDSGSGDWSSTGDDAGTCVVTFDPPFQTRPAISVTPNDGDGPITTQPDFGTYFDYVSGLCFTSVSADFSTLYIFCYDPDGNPFSVSGGFDFIAVAT